MRISDWSSDVCSSDLRVRFQASTLLTHIRTGRARNPTITSGWGAPQVVRFAHGTLLPKHPRRYRPGLPTRRWTNGQCLAEVARLRCLRAQHFDQYPRFRSDDRRVGKECVSTRCALVTGVQTCALPICEFVFKLPRF